MQYDDATFNRELDHVDFMVDGLCSLMSTSDAERNKLTGNESHYVFQSDILKYAGTENKVGDKIKEVASNLYKSITEMLKRISDYFFGEGEKAAEAAAEGSQATIDALMKMDGNTPISDDSPARNPDAIMKALEGGVEFNEIVEENSALGSAMASIRSAAEKVKGAATVAQLRSVLAEVQKASEKAIDEVSNSLRKTVSAANTAAGKLRNAKVPKDDDTSEVSSAIKQENAEASEEAKDETKKARIIGGMRNKIVSALNSVSATAKSIKEKPAESKFKG